jgi:hypothetical protein
VSSSLSDDDICVEKHFLIHCSTSPIKDIGLKICIIPKDVSFNWEKPIDHFQTFMSLQWNVRIIKM